MFSFAFSLLLLWNDSCQPTDVDNVLEWHTAIFDASTEKWSTLLQRSVASQKGRAPRLECASASPVTWMLFHIKPQGYMSGLPYGEIIKCVFPISSGAPELS